MVANLFFNIVFLLFDLAFFYSLDGFLCRLFPNVRCIRNSLLEFFLGRFHFFFEFRINLFFFSLGIAVFQRLVALMFRCTGFYLEIGGGRTDFLLSVILQFAFKFLGLRFGHLLTKLDLGFFGYFLYRYIVNSGQFLNDIFNFRRFVVSQ